jgi:hypothetical protein
VRATLPLVLCAFVLVVLTALTGSSDAIDPLTIQDDLAVSSGLSSANIVGQTFRSHFSRLHTIEVAWIVSGDFEFQSNSQALLHLQASPGDVTDLASASIPLREIKNNSFSKFVFPPIADSANRSYYFFLTIPRDAISRGSLALWSSSEDTYTDGAVQLNGAPARRDLAFRVYYEPDLGMLATALLATVPRFGASMFLVVAALVVTVWYAAQRSPRIFTLALGAASLLAFLVSMEQIRDLPAPLWVDSIAHAQYVQYILDHARLPANNFYHLGFHLLTALFAKVSNLSISQSLLLVGQLLWLETGIAAFVLSRRLSGGALAGLVAALCIWFLSPLPAYLLTWGRYPLILGSVILPLALVSALNLIEQSVATPRIILFAGIAFAMLAFSQIRLVAFYAAFVVTYLIMSRYQKRHSQGHARQIVVPSAIFAAFAFATALIWLGLLLSSGVTLPAILAENLQQPSIDLETAIDVAFTHHGLEMWLLAAHSLIVGIARRSRAAILVLGWTVLLTAFALIPPVFGALVPSSMIVLMAFLPASILIGDGAQWAYESLASPQRSVRAIVGVSAMACISLIGARDMVSIANPATVLFTGADESAMQWINANLPPRSKFLVNSFNWYGAAFVPSDGGGWIPFYTDNSIEYLDASSMRRDSESVLSRWIDAHKIDYIYFGPHSGVLYPSDFLSHPERFSVIYDREGIRIFQSRGAIGAK